jgi:hypothetical protein
VTAFSVGADLWPVVEADFAADHFAPPRNSAPRSPVQILFSRLDPFTKTAIATFPELRYLSRPLDKYSGEILAVAVEDNRPEDYYNDRQHSATRIQEHVI